MTAAVKMHVDDQWISEKIRGHGGGYRYSRTDGLAQIIFIGSTGRLKILWYNIQLFARFLRRRLKL